MRTFKTPFAIVCTAVLLACPSGGGGGTEGAGDFGDDFGDDAFDPCAPQIIRNISTNHGHSIDVNQDPDEILNGGVLIGGSRAGHSHSVRLNEGQLGTLLDGGTVTVETTSNSLHTHRITAGITFPPGCGQDDGQFDGQFDDGIPGGGNDDDG